MPTFLETVRPRTRCDDCNSREAARPSHRGLLMQWHITERCNLRCTHCYQDASPSPELAFPDLLRVLSQFRELVEARSRESGRALRGMINVTGGEPFVRADFMDLLDVLAAERSWMGFAILSNGTQIDAGVARKLSVLGPVFVQVSLDGTRATHDSIRGKGAFDCAVEGARRLVAEGIPTLLSFTAHRGNAGEFGDVVRIGRRIGVSRVWADRLIPCGSGAAFSGGVLSPEETRDFIASMARTRTRTWRSWFRWPEIAMHRALQFLGGGGMPYRCKAGDTLLAVQPNGDVYPCRRLPARVGNVLDQPLASIYAESGLLKALRDRGRVMRGCEECVHRLDCGGGLRCLAWAITGDPFTADPGCWLAAKSGQVEGTCRPGYDMANSKQGESRS